MASIERTAYPRFKKVVSARELYEAFTPTPGETAWAREATRTEGNPLVLVVLLKAFTASGTSPGSPRSRPPSWSMSAGDWA